MRPEVSSVGDTEFGVVGATEAETRVVATLFAEICFGSHHDGDHVLSQHLVERLRGLRFETVELRRRRSSRAQNARARLGRLLVVLVTQEQPALRTQK